MCCSVNGSVWLVCLTVFVNCLVKQFAICLGVVAILLFNVMGLFSVGGGAPKNVRVVHVNPVFLP